MKNGDAGVKDVSKAVAQQYSIDTRKGADNIVDLVAQRNGIDRKRLCVRLADGKPALDRLVRRQDHGVVFNDRQQIINVVFCKVQFLDGGRCG